MVLFISFPLSALGHDIRPRVNMIADDSRFYLGFVRLITDDGVLGQRRNLKSRLFKELNQPIDYTPKYTFKR